MRNGYYEVYELERAAAGRGDRDGKAAVRADAERCRRDRTKAADLAQFTRREETRSLCRRALRAQVEKELRESRALRAAAERQLEAPLTDQGQLVAAVRRGLLG